MYTELEKQLKSIIRDVTPNIEYPKKCKIIEVYNNGTVDLKTNFTEPTTLHNIKVIGNPLPEDTGVLIPVNGSWNKSICIATNFETNDDGKLFYVENGYLYLKQTNTGTMILDDGYEYVIPHIYINNEGELIIEDNNPNHHYYKDENNNLILEVKKE